VNCFETKTVKNRKPLILSNLVVQYMVVIFVSVNQNMAFAFLSKKLVTGESRHMRHVVKLL